MQVKSRTANSIHNAKVALVFYFINLILQFFSRKVFLDYLGAEVLGLNTTAQNLLGFLNLAELGIGAAVSYNLYRPLFDEDKQAINDIVSIQGWLYRRIAFIVIAGACVLMCFFPQIFAKVEVPLWYSYGTFLALLVSALLGYFVNYRQIVLSADQKEYKVTYCLKGGMAVKTIMQIIAIYTIANGYLWWLIIEVVSAFIIAWTLNRTIRREYPWLSPDFKKGGKLRIKYPQIITKTKQLFFHRIGGFVLSQTSPLIIYAYASLTLVAIYGNYMLIIMGVTSLMNALFNGIGSSVGNLIAEGDKKKIKVIYWKITFIRMWTASFICFVIYMCGDSFITLWIGEDFLLPHVPLIIIIVNAFITLTRTNDIFLAAYGLYQDIWSPIIEAVLNLGLSVLLGYYWGLTGILTGVCISLLTVVCCWKPYFLYKAGFREKIGEYVKRYIKYIGVILLSMYVCERLIHSTTEECVNSYIAWFIYCILFICVYGICSCILFCCTDSYARLFIKSVYKNILSKIK